MKPSKSIIKLLCASVIYFVASTGHALPSKEVWNYFYSDSSFYNMVGQEFVMSCYGKADAMFGKKTMFKIKAEESCSKPTYYKTVSCYYNGVLTQCPSNICSSALFKCN